MSSIVFDTHAFVKRLTEAGMSERQDEILTEEKTKLIDERLATKKDIEELKISKKRDMQELEYRIIIKLGTITALMPGVVVALVKLV